VHTVVPCKLLFLIFAVYKWHPGFQVLVFSYECPLLPVHLWLLIIIPCDRMCIALFEWWHHLSPENSLSFRMFVDDAPQIFEYTAWRTLTYLWCFCAAVLCPRNSKDISVLCVCLHWGTALETRRLWVQFPIALLGFFFFFILPAALWPWGQFSL
jgi:lysylphosphatidylglycerol synthetase-like protein (DUF2156 family)